MLPTFEEIEKWSDGHLKDVYDVLFNQNINPQITESQAEVDYYLACVDSEYENRGFKTNLFNPKTILVGRC